MPRSKPININTAIQKADSKESPQQRLERLIAAVKSETPDWHKEFYRDSISELIPLKKAIQETIPSLNDLSVYKLKSNAIAQISHWVDVEIDAKAEDIFRAINVAPQVSAQGLIARETREGLDFLEEHFKKKRDAFRDAIEEASDGRTIAEIAYRMTIVAKANLDKEKLRRAPAGFSSQA